jgi:RecA/RadA recombinase
MCISVESTIQTGSNCIDGSLKGGISPKSITLIYGEPETGKTTLTMQCAISCAQQGKKTLFMDCDNTFSPQRLMQIASKKFDLVAELIVLIKPKDFTEQAAVIDRLPEYTARNFGLIIIDTVTSLYRLKVAESSGKGFSLNRELNRQMAILAQTTKTQGIPLLITSQVSSIFNETSISVAPVATRVVKFWADTIIALKPTENLNSIQAVLEKTPWTNQEETCPLRIDQSGIHDNPFDE